MNEVFRSRSEVIRNKKRLRRKKRLLMMLKMVSVIVCLSLAALFIIHSINELRHGDRLFNPNQGNFSHRSQGGNVPDDEIIDQAGHDDGVEASTSRSEANADGSTDEDEKEEIVRFAFVGDVLLGSTVQNLLDAHGYDYPYIHVREQLRQADIGVANLETPFTKRGEPAEKQYVYRSNPEALPALQDAGFHIVNLANNHILDYGQDGLIDTLNILDEANMFHVGAGMDEEEAFAPVIVEHNNVRIAFLGFSQVVPEVSWKATKYQLGVADMYSLEKPLAAIESAAQKADLVIVLAHWGIEREDVPQERQIAAAHAFIDAGADLIVGSHPHVLQGFEMYKGKWIAYSLGNFIFTTNDYSPTWESVILQAECSETGDCALDVIPVWAKWAQPVPMNEQDGRTLFTRLENISQSFGEINIDAGGQITSSSLR